MKIILSTQKKDSFEVNVEQSTTTLDLKRMVMEYFGLPEDSLTQMSLVYQKSIIRDNTKTLLDLDVTEGSTIFFFVPSKYAPTRTKSQPMPKKVNQTPEPSNDDVKNTSSSHPLPKVQSSGETETPKPPSESNPPNPSDAPEEKDQKPPPKVPPISAFYSDQSGTDFNYNNYNTSNYKVNPEKVEKLKEMGFDDRHATVFLIASGNDLNAATDMITTPFYQDENNFNRLERYINHQMDAKETNEFTKDMMSSLCKSHGVSEAQANKATQMAQLVTAFATIAQAAKLKRQNSANRSDQIPIQNQNDFNQIPSSNRTNLSPNSSSAASNSMQLLQQMRDMIAQRSQQRTQQRSQQMKSLQGNFMILQMYSAALKEVKSMCKVEQDFFSNSFVEIKKMMIEQNWPKNEVFGYVSIAEKLNKDQMMFVSEQMNQGKMFEEILSIIDATDGDIESARAIMNSK